MDQYVLKYLKYQQPLTQIHTPGKSIVKNCTKFTFDELFCFVFKNLNIFQVCVANSNSIRQELKTFFYFTPNLKLSKHTEIM